MLRASDSSDADDDPSLEAIVGLLFLLTADLRQRFTDRAALFDLSFAQAMALRELDDPLPMRDLADRLCCDASNVTGIVDRLEARGLVERRTVAGDRRVKHIVLTEAGRAVREEHRQGFTNDLPLLHDLTPEDRRQLAVLLRRSVGEGRTSV